MTSFLYILNSVNGLTDPFPSLSSQKLHGMKWEPLVSIWKNDVGEEQQTFKAGIVQIFFDIQILWVLV